MFHRKLLEQDWNHVNDNFDLDTAVNSLHSTLEKLMNECHFQENRFECLLETLRG